MSRFKEIDLKLIALAKKLKAKLTKDRPDYPEALRTFEERRIDWIDNGINKAIIIQPNFEQGGINAAIWNFMNIAWYDDNESSIIPQRIIKIIDKKPFEIIENNIDHLLKESEENLIKITIKDLK